MYRLTHCWDAPYEIIDDFSTLLCKFLRLHLKSDRVLIFEIVSTGYLITIFEK
jgi:hypothetical protein